MTFERWLPIEGYEGLYEVSDHGRVRRLASIVQVTRGNQSFLRQVPERILKLTDRGRGYVVVCLSQDGLHSIQLVHRLVLQAFTGSPPTNEHQTGHRDGDRANNKLTNIRWITPQENSDERRMHGGHLYRFTSEERAAIVASTLSNIALSKIFNCHPSTIARHKARRED